MTAQTSIGEVYYSFHHEHFASGQAFGPAPAHRPIKAFTVCKMTIAGITFASYAYCAQSDQFNKEIGRKVALRKVLEQAKLSRSDRGAVWLSYHSRSWPEMYKQAVQMMDTMWHNHEAAY